MARKISPLTEVPFYPVRKDPQERFDTLIKAAVDGGATLTRELNATFIPAVNGIAGDVESAQSSVAADKEETKAKAGEAAASAQAAAGSAAAAKASQNAAKTSETNAKTSETNAAQARQDAAASADTATKKAGEAGTSAGEASKSAEAALASKNAAKTSETNAKTSETAAKASETKAKTSETAAAGSETKAKASETNAKASENAAKQSETAAKTSETNAGASEKRALTYRNEAEQFRNEASDIANVSMATTAKAGLVKPDGTTTRTDAVGKLTVKDVAIGGDLADLASARGQIGDSRNLASVGADLDTVLTDGIYGVRGSEAINCPSKCWCVLFVNSGFRTSDQHLHRQTLYETGVDQLSIFQRSTKAGGLWSPWTRILTADSAATATPKAPGTAAVGTAEKYAREDHVHPLPVQVKKTALDDGAYIDAVAAIASGGVRVGTVRISNDGGRNTILVGVHDEKDNAPVGLTITNTDGAIAASLPGSLQIGELSGELADVEEKHQALGSVSGAVTVYLSKGNSVSATIAGATTFTFSGAGAGKCRTVLLELTNGGKYTVTWGMNPHWSNGAAPTLTAAGVDCVALWNRGAGWSGVLVASDVK